MPDYDKMYLKLFNAISEVIKILQQAQVDTEEIYMSQNLDEANDEDK